MSRIYEFEETFPCFCRGENYNNFEEYYNELFEKDYELINVQLVHKDENEKTYIFWCK